MTDDDARELITSMGWEPLPFGCAGLARSARAGDDKIVWSWLILVPWAVNDAKPWIDGTKVFGLTLSSEAEQRAEIFQHMRNVLDERYGESVAGRSVEDLLRKLEEEG